MKEEKKVNVKESCCACEANFKNEVNHLVGEVEGYKKTDHDKKKKEIDAAFGKEKK